MPHNFSLRWMDGLQVLREEGQERPEGRRRVGCSARIKKLQRHDNGPWPATLTVIAEGALPLPFSAPFQNGLLYPSFLDAAPCKPLLYGFLVCLELNTKLSLSIKLCTMPHIS